MSVTNAAIASTSHRHLPDRVRLQAGNLLIGGLFGGIALEEDLREIFARSLGYWLRRREISQAEMARRLSISPSAITRWLKAEGGTDLLNLRDIANTLMIPGWYLLHDKPEELPDPASGGRPNVDETEQMLRFLATKLGYRIRVEAVKKG